MCYFCLGSLLLMCPQALKECADEIDLGTQYHLTRYAFLYESIVLSDGQILIPPDDGECPIHGPSDKS